MECGVTSARNNNRLEPAAGRAGIYVRLARYRIGYRSVSHPIPLRSLVQAGGKRGVQPDDGWRGLWWLSTRAGRHGLTEWSTTR